MQADHHEASRGMNSRAAGPRPHRAAVIVNPRSGSARTHRSAGERRAEAEKLFRDHEVEPDVWMTERRGHAGDLARRALDAGHTWVIAWGGDGTINEVAAAIAFSPAALSVIPSGSGNGLAREFNIPRSPDQALHSALDGRETIIDGGEIDGRLFFNMAGFGFDAHVARCFSTAAGGRRGAISYFLTTAREALRYRPQPMTIETGRETIVTSPLLVSVANGRQWGSGACIAPRARTNDGRLELVVVSGRWPPTTILGAWRLFNGTFDRSRIARTLTIEQTTIRSASPIALHLDGEPIGDRTTAEIRVRPSALRLRVAGSLPR